MILNDMMTIVITVLPGYTNIIDLCDYEVHVITYYFLWINLKTATVYPGESGDMLYWLCSYFATHHLMSVDGKYAKSIKPEVSNQNQNQNQKLTLFVLLILMTYYNKNKNIKKV